MTCSVGWLIAPLVLTAAIARADDLMVIESDQVLITVDAAAGGKQISAVSHSLEWSITMLGERRAHVHLRVPLASFDSGHGALDELVREAAGWMHHPGADIEGEISDGRFAGTLTVRGVSRRMEMPVEIARAGEQVIAHARVQIDLRDFGIAVPSLDGIAAVEFVARLHASPRAVFSGGSWHGT